MPSTTSSTNWTTGNSTRSLFFQSTLVHRPGPARPYGSMKQDSGGGMATDRWGYAAYSGLGKRVTGRPRGCGLTFFLTLGRRHVARVISAQEEQDRRRRNKADRRSNG